MASKESLLKIIMKVRFLLSLNAFIISKIFQQGHFFHKKTYFPTNSHSQKNEHFKPFANTKQAILTKPSTQKLTRPEQLYIVGSNLDKTQRKFSPE